VSGFFWHPRRDAYRVDGGHADALRAAGAELS